MAPCKTAKLIPGSASWRRGFPESAIFLLLCTGAKPSVQGWKPPLPTNRVTTSKEGLYPVSISQHIGVFLIPRPKSGILRAYPS